MLPRCLRGCWLCGVLKGSSGGSSPSPCVGCLDTTRGSEWCLQEQEEILPVYAKGQPLKAVDLKLFEQVKAEVVSVSQLAIASSVLT